MVVHALDSFDASQVARHHILTLPYTHYISQAVLSHDKYPSTIASFEVVRTIVVERKAAALWPNNTVSKGSSVKHPTQLTGQALN